MDTPTTAPAVAAAPENPNREGAAPEPGREPVIRHAFPPEIVALADIMKIPPEEIDPRSVLDFINGLLAKQVPATDAPADLAKFKSALEHIERAASNGHGPSQEFLRSL